MNKFIVKPCPHCGQNFKVINGLFLRNLREKNNLTQRELGKKLHISSPYISDIETNRRDCPKDILEYYLNLEISK